MNTSTHLQICGLTEVDLLELEELCPEMMKRSQAEGLSGTQHGDLGLTAAVVIVTIAVVQGLAVWMAKRRVKDIRTSNVSFEKLPDGTVRMNASQMSSGTLSESPDPQVVQALKTQLSEFLQLVPKP